VKPFDGTAIAGCFNAKHTLDIASVVNAFFACLLLFVFFCCCFFFHHPTFAWIALSGFQSTGE